MSRKTLLSFSGYFHQIPRQDATQDGDIHISFIEDHTKEYPLRIQSMHGKPRGRAIIKSVTLSKLEIKELISILQKMLILVLMVSTISCNKTIPFAGTNQYPIIIKTCKDWQKGPRIG